MRKRLILLMLVPVVVLLLWVFWIAVTSYIQAPRMVSELDRAGVLTFSPSDLPRRRLCALLVVQDPTFYRHQGIALADGPLGHTTITQSIGKGLFFNGFDPGFLHHRKIQLMIAAWAFNRRISKSTQLRLAPLMDQLVLQELGPHISSLRILDVGCATGRLLKRHAEAGAKQLFGADLAPGIPAVAAEKLSKAGIVADLRTMGGILFRWPQTEEGLSHAAAGRQSKNQ